MVELLKMDYWSRADAFLLPLTGLPKKNSIEMRSFLFWNEYSIKDYKLILSVQSDEYDEMMDFCKNVVFPALDKSLTPVIENYDIEDRTIFIIDMSYWAADIEMFLQGRYSRFSQRARGMIERFHIIQRNEVPAYIYCVLYPQTPMDLLDKMSPIEYISEYYEIPIESLRAVGEIGSVYKELDETLLTDVTALL